MIKTERNVIGLYCLHSFWRCVVHLILANPVRFCVSGGCDGNYTWYVLHSHMQLEHSLIIKTKGTSIFFSCKTNGIAIQLKLDYANHAHGIHSLHPWYSAVYANQNFPNCFSSGLALLREVLATYFISVISSNCFISRRKRRRRNSFSRRNTSLLNASDSNFETEITI